jgi:hypothetical protein
MSDETSPNPRLARWQTGRIEVTGAWKEKRRLAAAMRNVISRLVEIEAPEAELAAAADGLERYAAAVEKATGAQFAFVTLPRLEGEPIEDVANLLYRRWGVGLKGKNEGVLILTGKKVTVFVSEPRKVAGIDTVLKVDQLEYIRHAYQELGKNFALHQLDTSVSVEKTLADFRREIPPVLWQRWKA